MKSKSNSRQTGDDDKDLIPVPLQSSAELGLSADTFSEIDAKRKELEDKNNRFEHLADCLYCDKCDVEQQLKGFNLGVSMARKEFLEFLQEPIKEGSKNWVKEKIKELRQQIGVKDGN